MVLQLSRSIPDPCTTLSQGTYQTLSVSYLKLLRFVKQKIKLEEMDEEKGQKSRDFRQTCLQMRDNRRRCLPHGFNPTRPRSPRRLPRIEDDPDNGQLDTGRGAHRERPRHPEPSIAHMTVVSGGESGGNCHPWRRAPQELLVAQTRTTRTRSPSKAHTPNGRAQLPPPVQ